MVRLRPAWLAVPLAAAGLALAAGGQPARAGDGNDYFQTAPQSLTYQVDRPRPCSARVVIASLGGGAALAVGLATWFAFDAKHKADDVSTKPFKPSGRVYTEEVDDTRAAAYRSRDIAIAGFAIGGALLAGTVVAYYMTDPGSETVRVKLREPGVPPPPPPPPHATGGAALRVELGPGRAMVGEEWRF